MKKICCSQCRGKSFRDSNDWRGPWVEREVAKLHKCGTWVAWELEMLLYERFFLYNGNTKLLFGFPRWVEPAKCCWLQIFSSHGGCYAFIGSQMLRVFKFSLATEVWLDKASGAYWAWEGLALWLWAEIYCIMWQMIVAEGLASRTSDKLLDDWKARPYCTDLLCGRPFDICSSWTRLPGMVASCLLARPGGQSCNAAATPG